MSGISRIRRSGLAPVPFFEIDPLTAYLLPGTLNFSRTPNAIWSGDSSGTKAPRTDYCLSLSPGFAGEKPGLYVAFADFSSGRIQKLFTSDS